ncbi:MAG: flagellar basal body rod protein FlgB [Firmicutes bacterium]|nr:flagellar basal body rod protein FlgB [Bacillota bacterium]
MFLTDLGLRLAAAELDAAALRQRVIANNVANVNTPGFKKKAVRFEEFLRRALEEWRLGLLATDPRHLQPRPEIAPQVVTPTSATMRADGNNVDLEEEMVALAANTLAYQTAAQEAARRLALLSYVITGGTR